MIFATRCRDAGSPVVSTIVDDQLGSERNGVVTADRRRRGLRVWIASTVLGLDYRRFTGGSKLAVLLPHEPAPDHRDLLASVEVGWIWPDRRGRFRDSRGGELTGQ